jgi:O-antigen ligase
MSRLAHIVIIVWTIGLVLGVRYVFGEPQDFGPNQHFEYLRLFIPLSAVTSLLTIIYFRMQLRELFRNRKFLALLGLGLLLFIINAANAFRPGLAFFWLGFCLLTFLAAAAVYMAITKDNKISRTLLTTIITIGLAEAILSIFQASLGHSLGLSFLGEPIATDLTKGVAKLAIGDAILLRPFGTFPHSNVLGGMLVVALAAFLVKIRLFGNVRTSLPNYLIPGLLLIALLLTYSRSSWLAALILIIGFLTFERVRKILFVPIAVVTIAIIIGFPGVVGRFQLGEQKQQVEIRENLTSVATGMIRASPFWGVGLHNFVAKLDVGSSLETYEKQPVHNTFKLAPTELGVIVTAALLLVVGLAARSIIKRRNSTAIIVAASAVPILLLDHYLFSLFTGIGLLALFALIVLISTKTSVSRETDDQRLFN